MAAPTVLRNAGGPPRAAKHPVTLLRFEKGGGESLRVKWSEPGIERQPIPADRVWREPTASAASPWLTTPARTSGEWSDSTSARRTCRSDRSRVAARGSDIGGPALAMYKEAIA